MTRITLVLLIALLLPLSARADSTDAMKGYLQAFLSNPARLGPKVSVQRVSGSSLYIVRAQGETRAFKVTAQGIRPFGQSTVRPHPFQGLYSVEGAAIGRDQIAYFVRGPDGRRTVVTSPRYWR